MSTIEKKEFDIQKVIEGIKNLNLVFSTETDFQLAIASEIKKIYGEKSVICEFSPDYTSKVENKPSKIRIDILCVKGNIPIELKYRTKKKDCINQYGEGITQEVHLSNQGARDEGCYGFWKDVCRVNEYKKNKSCEKGYVVFLTNDSWYKDPSFLNEKYSEFNINDNNKKNCRSGLISAKKRVLTNVPAIKGEWHEWKVGSVENAMTYWCYIAEVPSTVPFEISASDRE